MCTGRSPFAGDTTGELLIAIVQQVQITPARLNPDVPEGLARIIDRCLEKDRDLRYQHAGEIRADLKAVQHDPAAGVDRPSPLPQKTPPSQTSSGPRTWDQAAREPASRRRWLAPLLGVLGIATAMVAYYRASAPPVPVVSNYTQLTHDGEAKFLAGTDGSRLYLGMENQTAPGIAQMPVTGGDPVRMPAPVYTLPVGISGDGSELLAIERQGLELLIQAVSGGCRRPMAHRAASVVCWSRMQPCLPTAPCWPIAIAATYFFLTLPGTEHASWLRSEDSSSHPDFLRMEDEFGSPGKSSPLEIVPFGRSLCRENTFIGCFPTGVNHPRANGNWTADGKFFVFEANGQIWALPDKTRLFERVNDKPVPLTSSPIPLSSPLPSKDGKKLFVVGSTLRGTPPLQPASSRIPTFSLRYFSRIHYVL